MKRTIISIAILATLGISGCSSTGSSVDEKKGMAPISQDWKVPIKDTALSVNFADDGIKIHYTVFGKLEKIEVFGQAPVWKGNPTILAEADASAKLTKFVHGKEVSSSETVKIIAKAIEKAQDGYTNEFDSKELKTAGEPVSNKTDSALRNAQTTNDTLVETVTTITARGRLTGMRKVKDFTQDNGRVYVAVYEWSPKDQATADQLRKIMAR